MPILSSEPCLFPEELFSADWSGDTARQWWVLHTRPRQEKSLARELLSGKVPFYLPLAPKIRQSSGRKRTSYIPLFAGYLFLHASEAERLAALRTNRIVATLPVTDASRLRDELGRIYRLTESDAPITIESQLAAGQKVRVMDGPFAGMEGTVLRRRQKTRIVMAVTMLQQGVSVEVDDFLLEAI